MTTGLPFVQAPRQSQLRRCGNADSGILEIPVLGGLTVGETALINQLLVLETTSFVAGAKAAEAIAKEETVRLGREFSLSEAFQIVENSVAGRVLEPEAEDIRLRHADRVEQVARIYAQAGTKQMEATVCALIACRLKLPNWSLEDTSTLHRALFEDIWKLAKDEQEAENMPSNPPTEAELKKQQPVAGSERKRRGRASSTTLPPDSPASSPESDLPESCAA